MRIGWARKRSRALLNRIWAQVTPRVQSMRLFQMPNECSPKIGEHLYLVPVLFEPSVFVALPRHRGLYYAAHRKVRTRSSAIVCISLYVTNSVWSFTLMGDLKSIV